jgi:hypothetical protein
MTSSGANRSADEIYRAATPSLATFPGHEFLFEPSSPWEMTGRLYENYERGLAVDPDTGLAISPDMLVVQLPSDDLYKDWELTQDGTMEMAPGGPTFIPLSGPQITDEDLERERRADPDMYKTEFGAKWRPAQDAYLPDDAVNDAFGPFNGEVLTIQPAGRLDRAYAAHGDPAWVNDRFGFAIGHIEPNTTDLPDVVFDVVHAWEPDGPEHPLDYLEVQDQLRGYLTAFPTIQTLTFDQHNSLGLQATLQAFVHERRSSFKPTISIVYATPGLIRDQYELFKQALLLRRVHIPEHILARLEMLFVRRAGDRIDHQTRGPVTSKDILDAIVSVTWNLLSPYAGVIDQLAGVEMHASQQGGIPLPISTMAEPFSLLDDINAKFRAAQRGAADRNRRFAGRPSRRNPPRGGGRPRWPT